MRKYNAAILGADPLHGETYLGLDGQLWRWGDRGQETVASGGEEAARYAESRGWPENVLMLLRSKIVSTGEK